MIPISLHRLRVPLEAGPVFGSIAALPELSSLVLVSLAFVAFVAHKY